MTPALLQAALGVKRMAGQINVIVHAVGILVSLPYVLEPGERIESLSLGAGNTGRLHDLETHRQIAEFKFIEWRGGPESIRQNSLFVDLFNLVSANTSKRRVLYVIGKETPLRFLRNRRALSSVLSRNRPSPIASTLCMETDSPPFATTTKRSPTRSRSWTSPTLCPRSDQTSSSRRELPPAVGAAVARRSPRAAHGPAFPTARLR